MNETVSDEVFNKYFSCFSMHPIEFEGQRYPTPEHAYHVQRYTDPVIIVEILNATSGAEAWEVSQRHKSEQRAGFNVEKVKIMEQILRAKVEQHSDVKEALQNTGTKAIIKNQPLDSFWGNGPDGSGQNELGRLWMKIRNEYRVPANA